MSINIKIKKTGTLKKILKRLKKQGKVIVFTNGCFDILHYGHVKYLEDARKKGDILVVGINTDSSVKKIKGDKRPIINEKNRARLLASLESVDYVVLFSNATPLETIKALRPDILVKGADWDKDSIVGGSLVKSYGGSVYSVKLVKGLSTTNIIKKIARSY